MSEGTGRPFSTPSSGNVFADLDLPDPDELELKAELVDRIRWSIADRKLSSAQAAALLGINSAGVTELVQGQLDRFSVEFLLRFLISLDYDVEIAVKPKADAHGRMKVA